MKKYYLLFLGLICLPVWLVSAPARETKHQVTAGSLKSFPAKHITCMTRGEKGSVYIGTEGDGLFRGEKGSDGNWRFKSASNVKGFPETPHIYALCRDQQGRIWVGTDRFGAAVYNGKTWKIYNLLNGPKGHRIFDIQCSPFNGDIAIAHNAGLCIYSPRQKRWFHISKCNTSLPENEITSLSFNTDGILWVALECGGIANASPKDNYQTWKRIQAPWSFSPDRPIPFPLTATGNGLPSNFSNVIFAAGKRVFCGTDQGLAYSNDSQNWSFLRGRDFADKIKGLFGGAPANWVTPEPKILTKCLPQDFITGLYLSKDGLWIGFRNNGFTLLDVKTLQTRERNPLIPGLNQAWVNGFLPVGNQTLFISTYGHGVFVASTVENPQPEKIFSNISFPEDVALWTKNEIVPLTRKLSGEPLLPVSSPWVLSLDADWATRGNWCERYGQRKAMLCAVNMPISQQQFGWDNRYGIWGDIGPHRQAKDALRHWVHWVNRPDNHNVLFDPSCHVREEAEWDDHGEDYKRSWEGPDIWVYVRIPNGAHRVSLYFYNPNGREGIERDRDYPIEVRVQNNNDNRGFVLCRGRARQFAGGGVYKNFVLNGGYAYAFRIIRNGSFNTILNGVFISQFSEPLDNLKREKDFLRAYCNHMPKPPSLSLSDLESIPNAGMTLWRLGGQNLQTETGILTQRRLREEAFRYSCSTASDTALTYLRWFSGVWEKGDEQNFESAMSICWAAQQAAFPTCRSKDWYPNSPNTVPFSRKELRLMDSERIDWTQYLPNSKPFIPIDKLKLKLKTDFHP